MKTKSLLIAFLAMFCTVCFFTSCQKQPAQSPYVEQQVTITEPHFFYLVKEVVQKGQTLWGRAKVNYGSGLKWRDIVAQNRFLQEPGRVWKDSTNGMWYALIYPGEKLIIDSNQVNPVFVDIVDAPVSQNQQPPVINNYETNYETYWIPWWAWLIIALLVILLLLLFVWRTTWFHEMRSISQNVSVAINNGNNIDTATRTAILEHEMAYRNRALAVIEKGANEKELLEFQVDEDSERFSISGTFKNNEPIPPVTNE